MTLREIIHYSLWFLLYLLLQILILRNIVLFDYAFCFVYIGAILLLPAEVNRTLLLIMGFLTGLLVDVFYNTLGMHAAATLLIAYLRPFWIQLQLETKGNTERLEISIPEWGVPCLSTPPGFYSPRGTLPYRNEPFRNDRVHPAADCGQYPVHDFPDHGYPLIFQALTHPIFLTIWPCCCPLARNLILYISQSAYCANNLHVSR